MFLSWVGQAVIRWSYSSPLVGISLTETPMSRWTKPHPAHSLMATMQFENKDTYFDLSTSVCSKHYVTPYHAREENTQFKCTSINCLVPL